MSTQALNPDVAQIIRALPTIDLTTATLVLFVMSGLPGTGKSFLARQIAHHLPCFIVESDFVRKTLTNGRPTYTNDESTRIHRVARAVIKHLLESGSNVISDATNLAEWHREKLYRVADETHAKLVIIQTIAPENVIRERLARRFVSRDAGDISDADWSIYEHLRTELEPIRRPHLVIDTSGDLTAALRKILRVATT
jgi:predicted kinase